MINKFNRILLQKNGLKLGIFIWLLLVSLVTIPKIFAELQPVKSIEIFSEKLNYNKNEAGSFKIEKSARWISKGVGEITFDVDTIMKTNGKYRDILFVLDISGSMEGDKLDKVKSDTIELINSLLSDNKNRAGLITFETDSQIVSPLTNNKDELIENVNNLTTGNTTNYYQALVNVDTVLKDYVKEDDRECIVLFLTDGYPNKNTPNEEGQYSYLKEQYPFITINAIQYEMGDEILKILGKISDKQYIAYMNTLNNVLQEASINTVTYDDFKISDFINSEKFIVEKESDIKVDKGTIKFDKSSQKIDWSISDFVSGTKANMTVRIKLKNEDDSFKYLTNSKEVISSEIGDIKENITSLKTPVLTDGYKVIYDGNEPSKCQIDVPQEKRYSVYDTVEITKNTPKCDGYEFKGWDISTKNIEKVNDDHFIMPDEDVYLRAVWSRLDLRKSMEGQVQEKITLYKQVQQDVNESSKFAKKYTGPSDTFAGNEEVYYYERGALNNVVIFAGYCWNMIRTTSTGGVKLLYSGLPTIDGKCSNIPENAYLTKEQMNTSSTKISFSNGFNSPADFGYMYNTEYSMESRNVTRKKVTVLKNFAIKSTTAYYYADSYNWDGTNYSLIDEERLVWGDNYQNLVGKYTYGKTSAVTGNPTLLYVLGAEENMLHYIVLSGGSGISEDKKETTLTLSKTITNTSSGNYLLAEPEIVNKVDWYQNHEKYKGYYLCGGDSLECSATMMKEILTTDNSTFTFYFVKKYGNTFTYENGEYSLVNAVDTASLWNGDSLSNTHYSCFNASGTCSTLSYVYYGDADKLYYINLTQGKSVEDAIYEMLHSPDVNKKNSQVKTAIDYWYQNNMTQYTDYLEDTVWCNDRGLRSDSAKTSGWNPNGGKINEYLYFRTTEDEDDLTCINELDRFTVSSDNGNGALTYPVGLLTKKENNMIEKGSGDMPYVWGNSFSLMSPGYILGDVMAFYISNSKEGYKNTDANTVVRPSVSLRAGIEYSSGNGSYDKPYVIDLSTYEYRVIIPTDANVRASKPLALSGENITLSSRRSGYAVTSFKLNGKLINGNSFVMPKGDANITDIAVAEELVIESAHPYSNDLDDVKEHTFPGATSLNVKLDIQTENTNYDYVYLYDNAGTQYGRYGGKTMSTENITIPGNYIKILFHTDESNYNYYGYKATITPNYN